MTSWVVQLRERNYRESLGICFQDFQGPPPKGYYFVRDCDGLRAFIGSSVLSSYLDKVCDMYLSEKTGWGYWIDYYHGLDIKGNAWWANVDLSDNFL